MYLTSLTSRSPNLFFTQLEDDLHHDRQRIQDLEADVEERDQRIAGLEQEHQFALDNIARLQENLKQRDTEIQQNTQRVVAAENEAERLHEEISTLKREYQRHLSEQTRALEDVTGQQDQTQHQMNEIVRDKAAVDIELKTLKERVTVYQEDAERLRRQIQSLQQESADKEVKIIQANKQHAQDKQDMYGLNMALDSKQQELELVCRVYLSFAFIYLVSCQIKRKLSVKGTAVVRQLQRRKSHNTVVTLPSSAPRP